jgi:hypothetical protein
MTAADDVTPIRISGPAGLLAAIPPLLGFHPADSLVLLCISGGRRRVGPVARVDLPHGHDRELALQLTSHAQHHADEVAVVCYLEGSKRPSLLDDLLGELARAQVDVMDAMIVRGGRARPALNPAMERAHPGIPMPSADDPVVCALEAAGALSGRSVLPSRDALRRSIAGPTGEKLREAERGISRAAAGHLPRPGDTGDGKVVTLRTGVQAHRRGVRSAIWDLLEMACSQVAGTGTVPVQIGTAVATVLVEPAVRDAVLAAAFRDLDGPWLPTMIASATWTPDSLAGPLCSVLAALAYRHGDGALAQIAVDRCLKAEPGNALALILLKIMSEGERPEVLDQLIPAAAKYL